ncbi:MAG: zinc ABC transporter substrate-binding protein [Thermoguttaceae bacterium]|nr:zinc ABC transporter substrate-binding protein [Thermoguttaceae bacterium]
MNWSRRHYAVIVVAGVLGAMLATLVAIPSGATSDGPLAVAVTIPPQAELVERIAGDRVRVEIAVPPGQDPHTFSPSPRQVLSLSRARLYFRIGLPLEEQLLPKLSGASRTMVVVDTIEGLSRRTFADHEGHACDGHHHHAHDGHGHTCQAHAGQPDPHVWLAPSLLSLQAERICEALCKADPAVAEVYQANLSKLQTRLEEVEAEMAAKLKHYRGRAFYVFHPAFGYFADACGLRQVAVEMEGKSPSPRQLRTLIARAKAEDVKVIFVQPQFDQRSAQSIAAAIGGSVVVIDPLWKNVVENLVEIAAQLQRGFEQ